MALSLPLASRVRALVHGDSLAMPLALLLAGHVLLWTWVGITSRSNFDAPGDMVEAYVWAQGWQWGYYKHPPLSAWVTGLWFKLVPESHAGFSLLAALNTAVGLAGLAWLARDLLPRQWVLVVAVIASLTPGLTSLAMRFNANAILVSTWPWAMALFVRMMQHGRTRDAIGCGIVCALAMLGKYYSAVLLFTLLAAGLWLPAWRQRLASRTFAIALAVFAACVLPHLLWLRSQAEGPLQYARAAAGGDTGNSVLRALNFALAQFAFPLIAMVVFAFVLTGPRRWPALRAALLAPLLPRGQLVWLLAALPIVATMLGTVLIGARTASVWGLPIAGGLALLAASRAQEAGARIDFSRLRRALLVVWVIVAAASPLWWIVRTQAGSATGAEPREELAHALQSIWRQEQGRDLPWISGTRALAASVSFYAAAHPRYWSLWNASVETPWTDAQAVRRDGGFIVCAHDDEACVALATRWTAQQRTVAVAKSHLGWRFEPRTYRVFTLQPLPQP